jgi:hypothetical protein
MQGIIVMPESVYFETFYQFIKLFLAGFEVLTAVVMKNTIFWDTTPCSLLSVNRRFGGSYCHLLARWFLDELIFSTLKMEAICSSKMPVDTQWTTQHYIPEVDTLYNHRCENLKSYKAPMLAISSLCTFLVFLAARN